MSSFILSRQPFGPWVILLAREGWSPNKMNSTHQIFPPPPRKMNLRPHPCTQTMPATLKIADLHEDYCGVSQEEAIAMANLGAVCYKAVKAGLYEQWSASMEGDESSRAEIWRSEGRQAMLETVKSKLAAADEAAARAAAAEGVIQQLRASVEAEAARRVAEALEGHRKDYELAKMAEISAMKERIAMAEGKGEYVQMLSEAHGAMKEKIASLEAQLAQQLAANTKSSYAIGKAGEATVFELLNSHVIPMLPYASVKDMTAINHAADFHVSVMLETGVKAKLLIDSKKYKRRVNTTEIEKLYADVDADEEASGGVMLSLESHIFTMKQFQIARSPKQKPVVFLSFYDISDEYRKDMITWAVRILIDILSQNSSEDKDVMIANLDGFLNSLDESVTELDGSLKGLTKTIDTLKAMRDGLIRKVVNFRAGKPMETAIETALLEGCSHVTRAGTKCGRKLIGGTTFCKSHMKKEEE